MITKYHLLLAAVLISGRSYADSNPSSDLNPHPTHSVKLINEQSPMAISYETNAVKVPAAILANEQLPYFAWLNTTELVAPENTATHELTLSEKQTGTSTQTGISDYDLIFVLLADPTLQNIQELKLESLGVMKYRFRYMPQSTGAHHVFVLAKRNGKATRYIAQSSLAVPGLHRSPDRRMETARIAEDSYTYCMTFSSDPIVGREVEASLSLTDPQKNNVMRLASAHNAKIIMISEDGSLATIYHPTDPAALHSVPVLFSMNFAAAGFWRAIIDININGRPVRQLFGLNVTECKSGLE